LDDYGIEIYHVTEIIEIQTITELPDMPSYVKGVINLYGKVIPVIDVRRRFKLTEREDDDKTCIVVININNTLIGLVVDTVNDVAHIPENQIVPPPDFSEENRQLFVKGLGKVKDGVNILLDVKKLLRQDDAITIKSMATNQNAANAYPVLLITARQKNQLCQLNF
jgi:purine-binding chemotaxis protein CheW